MADSHANQDEFSELYREREQQEEAATNKTDGHTDDIGIATTQIVPSTIMNRQERDIILAGMLLEEQIVDERKLSKAVSDWTIHGNKPLLEHLIEKGLISSEDGEVLGVRVTARVQHFTSAASLDAVTESGATIVPMEQLDESGQAATILGISSNLYLKQQEQSRRFSGDYTLLRKLGQGGLGIVWLARDNSLKRYVAIKEVTDRARNNPAAISRFRREAVITGRLEHPSIVPIHQFAEEMGSGQTFYVMRFLGKQTLQDAINEYHERREAGEHNPMQLHHLLTAFVSVCQAIGYAHSKDVVHRDLKPENVTLDGFGQVVVLDWGLAKLIGNVDLLDGIQMDVGDSPTSSNQTMAGQVLGTPMYMSPEQAAGRIDDIDERTDVYGLGAILFAIVTGYAPHEVSHRSLSSQSKVGDLLSAIMNDPTPRATALNPDISVELDAICSRALAKKRFSRYQSATELAEDIQRWMAGEPISAYEEPWKKRAHRWVRKHSRLSQFIAAVTTVIIVSAIAMGLVTHQNRVAAEDARLDSLREEANELEIRLVSRTVTLTNHVRFMSELPPIQGLIDAQRGDENTDEESVWRERLQTIFQGLLRSNQNYLEVSYSSVDEKEVQELVRVERSAADGGLVRVLPESRLHTFERMPNVEKILSLSPGDVFLIDSTAVEQKEATTGVANLTLLAATPIYDEQTGSVFGIVTIEMNLEYVLEFLINTTNIAANIYVSDQEGNIVMHFSRERGLKKGIENRHIQDVVPELTGFFSDSQHSDIRTDDATFHAIRVPLDSRKGSSVIGLILTFDRTM